MATSANYHVVAFDGGGCTGEFLRLDGQGVTRDADYARLFHSASDAAAYLTDYRLLGLNRPRRAVRIVPRPSAFEEG